MGLDHQSQVLENSRPLATRVDTVTTAGGAVKCVVLYNGTAWVGI